LLDTKDKINKTKVAIEDKTQFTKGLAETGAEFLADALRSIEQQLKENIEDVGEVSVIFTWNKKDYRISLNPFSEGIHTQCKK
jgi:methionyl-tRNA formyltransferase